MSGSELDAGFVYLRESVACSAHCASSLDEPVTRSLRTPIVAALGAACIHAAVLGLALGASAHHERALAPPPRVTQMVEVALPPAPALAPPEPGEPAPPPTAAAAPKPIAARVAPKRVSRPEPAKVDPPPSAAEAAKVIAAADETLDFGDSIVSGKAAGFAGGVTANAGMATHAVSDARARAGGVEDPGDASRAPRLAGDARWDCPFPEEADDAGIDRASVSLRVELAADGSVLKVQATKDPGYGFAREARKCAERKRWLPALDRSGQPVQASALVNVRFSR